MKSRIVALLSLSFTLGACATAKKVAEQEPADPNIAYYVERARAIEEMTKNFERVHFEFDSAQITTDTRDALAENVDLMRKFRDLGLEVEGHCDETGSTEYNLALGQRRADAIRKYMVTSGIAGFRVRTISYGEERVFEPGSDGFNRRAEFRITIHAGRSVDGTVPSVEDELAAVR